MNGVAIGNTGGHPPPPASSSINGVAATSTDVLQQTRQEFFAAYMSKAKAKMKITINEATVKALIGG